jgi:hypothetical protein
MMVRHFAAVIAGGAHASEQHHRGGEVEQRPGGANAADGEKAHEQTLRALGVPRSQIKTDAFAGLV